MNTPEPGKPLSLDDNPFAPGFGRPPPVLAGREDDIRDMTERIRELVPGAVKGPQAIVIYGPRGVGKTALVMKMAEKCRSRGARTLLASALTELRDASDVAPLLVGTNIIGEYIEKITRGKVKKDALPDKFELGVPGFFKATHDLGNAPAVREVKKVLMDACAKQPMALFVDEAHSLEEETIRSLLDYAQTVAGYAPFLLVLAGTPGLRRTC